MSYTVYEEEFEGSYPVYPGGYVSVLRVAACSLSPIIFRQSPVCVEPAWNTHTKTCLHPMDFSHREEFYNLLAVNSGSTEVCTTV